MTDQTATEEQFIRELHWCIEQLHLGLETQNPDSKQAREAQKVLKILCSDKAAVIKKRQAMRNTFGDYRQKMLNAEKKSAATLKKTKMTPKADSSSSVFYKKSASTQYNRQSGDEPSSMGDNCEEMGDNSMKSIEDDVSERLGNFTFVKSDENFTFGFQSPEKSSVNDLDTENSKKDSAIGSQCGSLAAETFVLQKTDNSFRFNFAGPS
ncbi:UPF0488 protein C8orf33 homolog [Mizuhopecten yessoensis]|uniref:UPF0488 protein C8orf33-like n=1 Tax=Mizuhopecten yessoensis TaxID=6573 RepID=A0A210Q2W5_MIZYE|nr:UPF0488 protein C8orf33 homolog [Mizuhopecten yessoensis]OWF43080.1 UPF0488 protein C8orf33-like [Mizuhopecten yessoensis]